MINTWQCKLSSLLQIPPESENCSRRISLIGIGYELGGDDAAGIALIHRLQTQLPDLATLQLIEAGTAPENITGAVRRFRPDRILLVDAADFSGSPGQIELLDWKDTVGFSASTHSLPLHVFAQYLSSEMNCPVTLIGIQPLSLEFAAPLSAPVNQAVDKLISQLTLLVCPPAKKI